MKIIYTNQFKRDYKKAKKQNKDISKLETLVAGEPLDSRHRDHPLTGRWKGFRDCHIEPDWLLIYRLTKEMLSLERAG